MKIYSEWDNYFNDGFDIFSINNGIHNHNQMNYLHKDVIEFNLTNGLEFSFKEENERDAVATNDEDQLVNIEEPIIVKTEANLKHEDNKENISCINTEILQEDKVSSDKIKEEQNLIKKETEIKELNDKLNAYKLQNKLVLEENKKLLEIISIFKTIQNLDLTDKEKSKGFNTEKLKPTVAKEQKIRTSYIEIGTTRQKKSYGVIHSNKLKSQNYSNIDHKSRTDQLEIKPKTYININLTNKSQVNSKFKHDQCKDVHPTVNIQNYHRSNISYIQNPKSDNDKAMINHHDNSSSSRHNKEIDKNLYWTLEEKIDEEDEDMSVIEKQIDNKFEDVISKLEHYKEENTNLIPRISSQEIENLQSEIERRKSCTESLENVLEYIHSCQEQEEIKSKEETIPFHLVDKRKLYEKIVKYMYTKEITCKPKFQKVTNSILRKKQKDLNS